MRTNLAIAMLIFAMLSGCTAVDEAMDSASSSASPVTSALSSTASSVSSSATALLHDYQLVSVSVTDRYSAAGARYSRAEFFSYFSPLDGYSKVVSAWPGYAPVTREAPASPQMVALAIPLSTTLDPFDQPGLNTTLGTLAALAGTPAANTTINYWLGALTGVPTWVVTTTYQNNATSSRHFLDVATGTVFELNATSVAGAGSPPAPNYPDIGFFVAETTASALASLWSSDSILYVVNGPESKEFGEPQGLFMSLRIDEWTKTPNVFVPPDLAPGDGGVSMWMLVYYSAIHNQLLPIYVYANAIAIQGDPIAPHWDAETYGRATIRPDLMIDSTEAAAHVRGPLLGRFLHHYEVVHTYHAWQLAYDNYHVNWITVQPDDVAVHCEPHGGCA